MLRTAPMTEPPTKPTEVQESANEIFALAGEENQERERVSVKREQARSVFTRERVVLASLVAGIPILVVLVLINIVGLSFGQWLETRPSPAAAQQEAQDTLNTLVIDIEAFRKDYNELPESLVEIGVPARGQWSYSVSGPNNYRVQGTLYGQRVSFDGSAAKRLMKDRQ